MAPTMVKLLALLSAFTLAGKSAPVDDLVNIDSGLDLNLGLLFPFPFCSSTTTVTLGGTYTVTSTSTVTSATSTKTVTALPVASVTRVSTTIYTPTDVSCISTATTFAPYLAPLGTLAARVAAPEITGPAVPYGCPTVSPITIIPPTITGKPCTCITGKYDITTSITTVTSKGVSTTTTTPTTVITKTETWIQPTPTAYNGINYYQYINGYDYNHNTNGLGGGGYDTANWNGNYSYYTSGLTRNIDFESPNWPIGPAVCQLPGQTAATDCTQWTVVFQGFLYAIRAGDYTVYAPTSSESSRWEDNSGFWWGGEKAYSSYTNENVDGGATGHAVPGVPNSFNYTLAVGEFLPITFIWSNGQGPAANRITITSPDGTEYPDNLDLFVPPCSESPFVP